MGHTLDDLARHNSWATAQILTYCLELDDATLHATLPGTYGTIIATVQHLIDSEASYLARLLGERPTSLRREDAAVEISVLAERAAVVATMWARYLAGDVDCERLGEARRSEDEVYAVPAGVFITQALHHANEHRAHVCTILGAMGHTPPDVSAWGYALATGRATLKPQAPEV